MSVLPTNFTNRNLRFSNRQTDIALNTVHNFEVRRSGGFTRLFLDSVEATTPYASGTETVISNSSRFCVGKGGSTASLFEGTMIESVV